MKMGVLRGDAASAIESRQHHSRPARQYHVGGTSPESIALAQEEIKELAGKEFDPEIVNEFLRMPANIWQELRNNIDSERD